LGQVLNYVARLKAPRGPNSRKPPNSEARKTGVHSKGSVAKARRAEGEKFLRDGKQKKRKKRISKRHRFQYLGGKNQRGSSQKELTGRTQGPSGRGSTAGQGIIADRLQVNKTCSQRVGPHTD